MMEGRPVLRKVTPRTPAAVQPTTTASPSPKPERKFGTQVSSGLETFRITFGLSAELSLSELMEAYTMMTEEGVYPAEWEKRRKEKKESENKKEKEIETNNNAKEREREEEEKRKKEDEEKARKEKEREKEREREKEKEKERKAKEEREKKEREAKEREEQERLKKQQEEEKKKKNKIDSAVTSTPSKPEEKSSPEKVGKAEPPKSLATGDDTKDKPIGNDQGSISDSGKPSDDKKVGSPRNDPKNQIADGSSTAGHLKDEREETKPVKGKEGGATDEARSPSSSDVIVEKKTGDKEPSPGKQEKQEQPTTTPTATATEEGQKEAQKEKPATHTTPTTPTTPTTKKDDPSPAGTPRDDDLDDLSSSLGLGDDDDDGGDDEDASGIGSSDDFDRDLGLLRRANTSSDTSFRTRTASSSSSRDLRRAASGNSGMSRSMSNVGLGSAGQKAKKAVSGIDPPRGLSHENIGMPPGPLSKYADAYFVDKFRGNTFILKEGENYLGRSSKNELCVLSASLSRRHCCFEKKGEEVTVLDLGSTHGSLVNLKNALEKTPIKRGDVVMCATTVIAFGWNIPLMESPLKKRGALRKYKEFYFVLKERHSSSPSLSWYKPSKERNPSVGSIEVADVLGMAEDNKETRFSIKTKKGQQMHLQAESEEMRSKWIAALSRTLKFIRLNSNEVSSTRPTTKRKSSASSNSQFGI